MQKIHGVDVNTDLDPALIHRETRPLRYRFNDFVAENGGIVLLLIAVIAYILPYMEGVWQISDILMVLGLGFAFYAKSRRKTYTFRSPISHDRKGDIIDEDDAGIFCVGNDLSTNSGLWFSDSDFRTHLLVFGSTGSGKSVFLLGLLYQALLVGSGVLYVDGKADNTIFWLVYSLVRRLDRIDDLLVINYLLGGETINDEDTSLGRLSNTTNPFAHGNAEQLRSLVVGLMRESAGDGELWKGRASAMLGGLLKALCNMRDREELNLDVSTIRHYLPLDRIVELSQRTDLPESAISPIRKYLAELPGFTEEDAIMGQIQPKAYEQHGYLTMQLTEVMADLSDTYGHIFSAPLGEVDFKDVVFQRRILFVMLPALEADPDRLAGLGKMVVAGVRSALAPALGNKLEGNRTDVIEQKPTNSKVPFLLILDEYGYYSVKGFAVVAAQARSLGVSCVFAGQDYPSFKKGSEEEAASTVANTNIKFVLKLEDAKETFELMLARGGEAQVSLTYGHDRARNDQLGTEFVDKGETRIEKHNRLNVRDLVNQKPGQAHVMFGDKISRCQLFYVRPAEVYEARLNKFVMIEGPSKGKRESLKGTFDKLDRIFSGEDLQKVEEKPGRRFRKKDKPANSGLDKTLKAAFEDFRLAQDRGQSTLISSIYATGMIEYRETLKDIDIERKAGISDSDDKPAKETPLKVNINKENIIGDASSLPLDDESLLEILSDDDVSERSIRIEAEAIENSFTKVLEKSVLNTFSARSNTPLSAKEKTDSKPSNQLKKIASDLGGSESMSEVEAEKAMSVLNEKVLYPRKPTPAKLTQDQINNAVTSLIGRIDEQTNF